MDKATIYKFRCKEDAMEKIKNIVKKEDAILIKASNAMKFDEITKELLKQYIKMQYAKSTKVYQI